MSVEQDVYFVAVEGSRKNIVRMMNAALRKFEIQEPITEDAKSWPDIARQYECCVFLDDEFYRDARFVAFVSASIDDATDGELRSIHLDSGIHGEEFPIFLRTLAYMYPARYVPMWEKYHGEHPEVEYSREECLAWAEKQQEMFRQNASVKDHLPG